MSSETTTAVDTEETNHVNVKKVSGVEKVNSPPANTAPSAEKPAPKKKKAAAAPMPTASSTASRTASPKGLETPPSMETATAKQNVSFPMGALPGLLTSSQLSSAMPHPRFRLLHPHGFRMLKSSSAVERSMRNYFRLPEAPSDVVQSERRRVQLQLVQFEKDELEEERRVAGGSRNGVALDGFLLLNAANTEAPEEVEVVTLQTSKLVRSVPEDLAYFQNLFFLDVSENELLLEDVLMLGGMETLHIAYNKIRSLRGVDDVLQWQIDHQKSIIEEFTPANTNIEENEIPYDVLLPRLTALNISYNLVPPQDLSLLAYFPSLQQLDLSGNNLSTLPLEISALVSVTHLALENNCFTSSSRYGPDVFLALSTMPSLTEVNLNHNKLSSVPALAPVPGCCFFPAIEVVGLTHNNFKTVNSILELANLHQTLRRVALSDTPLSKDPNGVKRARAQFDQVVVNAYLDTVPASGAFESCGTSQKMGMTAEGAPQPSREHEDIWKNESWSRLIPVRDVPKPPKLDVKSAAAAAAAAASAERQHETEGDQSHALPSEVQRSADGSPVNENLFFPPDEEYVRCDDLVLDEEEEEPEPKVEEVYTSTNGEACDDDVGGSEGQHPAPEGVPLGATRQYNSAEEYLDDFYVELVFKDSFMPKKSTRHFLSMTTSSGTRSQLVTIPEYQEFMDIYRLAGGKRAQFKREEQRRKQKGVRPATPLIITKESEVEQQLNPLSPHRTAFSARSCVASPVEEVLVPSVSTTTNTTTDTTTDDVFLTAVNEESDYKPMAQRPPPPPPLNKDVKTSEAQNSASRPLKPVLPSVCPVTTNVHGAMTELRALLRKPLPSLPYATAHLTAPKKAKGPRR